MTNLIRALHVFFVVGLLLVATPSGALEPNVEEGRARFSRGVELFRERDFAAASVEFHRAYEAAPSYRILFNIGQTAHELKDYVGALDAFERYLAEGGTEVPAHLRTVATAQIEKLTPQVGRIRVRTNVSGARVTLDDIAIGVTPLEKPLRVSAGTRKVAASRAGYDNAEQTIEVAGGASVAVDLELTAAPTRTAPLRSRRARSVATPHATPTRRASVPAASGLPTRVVIGAVVTGTLLTATAITGVFALRAKSDYDAKANTFGTSASQLDEQRDRTSRLALATDVLAGLSAAACALTIYFAVSPRDSAAPSESARTRLHVGPGSVVLSRGF
jgi:hypothetical protein